MSLHDDYARRTPFELAFPDRSTVERLSAEVAEEAERRGADDSLLETFMTTTAVGARVREMSGPDAPPESGYPFASLLYHAVHFLRAGAPLYLLDTAVTRRLVGPAWQDRDTPEESPRPEPPSTAGYLQLPRHLVWTEGDGGDRAPESLDGLFWTVTGSRMLNVLPVAGLLPDRPGFGALPLPCAPLADALLWSDATVRPSGDDFASTLPGGELDRLYAVRTAGEVLKLLARFFTLLRSATKGDAGGVRLEPRRPDERRESRPAGAPPSSGLVYTRVSLAG